MRARSITVICSDHSLEKPSQKADRLNAIGDHLEVGKPVCVKIVMR